MLSVDLRLVEEGPVVVQATVPPDDPTFEGLVMSLVGPVEVGGRIVATGNDDLLWHGQLSARVAGECRRCLAPLEQVVDSGIEVVFSDNPDLLEDPNVYPLDARATAVDLAPAVREELALLVEPFPLCREDCAGFCATCGADLNAGPCSCMAPGTTN
jgi:uncharacterized protein